MDHPHLPLEAVLLRNALSLIMLAGFAMSSASRALAENRQDSWSGQAQCELTVQGSTYSYQEVQTWTITGVPNATLSMAYPATWSVVGEGQLQNTQGTQMTTAQWTTNVPPMNASLAIFVNSARQLIIKPYHAQMRVDAAVTGSRQVSIAGAAQKASTVAFAEFEWQFPQIEVEATKNDVNGTSSTPITSSIGPMEPPRLPGTANCQWKFSKGAAPSPGTANPASQANNQSPDSPGVTAAMIAPAAATSSDKFTTSGTAIPAGQRSAPPGGGLSGTPEVVTTKTAKAPGATASTSCQAVQRPRDPMVMGTLRAGKSVSHSGTLSSVADSNFFQVKLPAGVDADFFLAGIQPGSDFDLYVYRSDYSPIACSVTRGTDSKNVKTEFGRLQNSNVVIVEVRSYTWNANSPTYTLTFKGVADGVTAP